MSTEPLFDYDKINETIRAAKSNRAQFLLQQFSRIKGPTRWWSFASLLTFFRQRLHFSRAGLEKEPTDHNDAAVLARQQPQI